MTSLLIKFYPKNNFIQNFQGVGLSLATPVCQNVSPIASQK